MTPQPFTAWYLFSTNGEDGFLLDLISRPWESLARLVTYRQGRPPCVVRHGFPPGSVDGVPGALGVNLGGIELDALGCRSGLPGMQLDARFALNERPVRLVPGYITWLFDQIPDFRSQYGAISQAVCEGAAIANAPVTCSTYTLQDFGRARWVLISAPRFAGTDLAFEISAGRLLGRWMPSARVFLNGREYRLTSPLHSLFRLHIERDGAVDSAERVFAASLRASGWRLDIEARAPLHQFARLDSGLATEIHTTLFGTCRATLSSTRQTFVAERTCLLEVKN